MLFQAMKPLVKGTGPEIWEQAGGSCMLLLQLQAPMALLLTFLVFLKIMVSLMIQALSVLSWKSVPRDYFHVMDLADDHVSALKKIFTKEDIGCFACNLGTVKGTSVLQWLLRYRKLSERKFLLNFAQEGQEMLLKVYASANKAASELD
ncbi:hypothetical protein Tco_0757752 [Tanacetum coccineum]